MFLQPLCKSLWQLRYALYHTNISTPSPPSLSQAGFSARSLLVGFLKLRLMAQPQLPPAGLIPAEFASYSHGEIQLNHPQRAGTHPSENLSMTQSECKLGLQCPPEPSRLHPEQQVLQQSMDADMDGAAEACVGSEEHRCRAGQLAHPILFTLSRHWGKTPTNFQVAFHPQAVTQPAKPAEKWHLLFSPGYSLLQKEEARTRAFLM